MIDERGSSELLLRMVYGPPSQKITSLSSLNTSIEEIYQAIDGTWKKNGIPPTGFPVFCDVRDLALAHVRAVELDMAKGQRYLFVEGHFVRLTLLISILPHRRLLLCVI